MANKILLEVRQEIKDWTAGGNKQPVLKYIYIGEIQKSFFSESSLKAAKQVGVDMEIITLPVDIRQNELLADISRLNDDHNVDGIEIRLPLPDHINTRDVCNAIAPHKDIGGHNIVNVGRLVLNLSTIVPYKAAAIREIIKRSGIETAGKTAVVCGRAHDIGLPVSLMLYSDSAGDIPGMNATTTIVHHLTSRENLAYLTKNADIIVSSCGIAKLIKPDMVKFGACVIDAGYNVIVDEKTGERRLTGDVDFEGVSKVAGLITPVPGGVGPVSIAMAMINLVSLVKKKVVYDIFEPGAELNRVVSKTEPKK